MRMPLMLRISWSQPTFWCQPQEPCAREDVDRSIGRLPDFPDALFQVGQQLLLGDDAIAVQDETDQVLTAIAPMNRLPFHSGNRSPV